MYIHPSLSIIMELPFYLLLIRSFEDVILYLIRSLVTWWIASPDYMIQLEPNHENC